ncbi:hypothetical protein BHM03_00014595, partial [Ensete ventricosum]
EICIGSQYRFRRAAGSGNKPGPFLSSRTISRYISPHPYPTRPHRESNLTNIRIGPRRRPRRYPSDAAPSLLTLPDALPVDFHCFLSSSWSQTSKVCSSVLIQALRSRFIGSPHPNCLPHRRYQAGRFQGTRWMHYLKQLSAANVPAALIENGQNRVIDASLTLIRERAKLKVTTGERCRLRVFCSPNSLFVPLVFVIKSLNRVSANP